MSTPRKARKGETFWMKAKELHDWWQTVRAGTRRLVEAIPPDKLDFRATCEVMSFAELILHVLSAERTFVATAKAGRLERMPRYDRAAFPALGDILALLDRQSAETRAFLGSLTDEQLTAPTPSPHGQGTMSDLFVRSLLHEMLHRGNMVTYLRLVGVKPPQW